VKNLLLKKNILARGINTIASLQEQIFHPLR